MICDFFARISRLNCFSEFSSRIYFMFFLGKEKDFLSITGTSDSFVTRERWRHWSTVEVYCAAFPLNKQSCTAAATTINVLVFILNAANSSERFDCVGALIKIDSLDHSPSENAKLQIYRTLFLLFDWSRKLLPICLSANNRIGIKVKIFVY